MPVFFPLFLNLYRRQHEWIMKEKESKHWLAAL